MPTLNSLIADKAQKIKHILWRTGHLHRPFGELQSLPVSIPEPTVSVIDQGESPFELDGIELEEEACRRAIESYQHFMVNNLEPLIAKLHPERRSAAPRIDGKIGPAMLELFDLPRCGMPDYTATDAEEAVGSGQWRSCHDVGNFHGAIVRLIDEPPTHLKRPYQGGTVWDDVKRRCRECYAEIGLRFWFSDDDDVPEGRHQTDLTFPFRGAGWIGLALIGQGQQCSSSPIWLRLAASYLQSSPITDNYLRLWANLLIHELGHNCGSGHTSGGIMNPGILSVPNRWIGDPAESRMKAWFGGQPVPLDNDPPPPPPPGPDPKAWSGSISNKATGQVIALAGLEYTDPSKRS